MTDVPAVRTIIQIESVRFRSAVSESLLQKMAGMNNFLATHVFQEKQFPLNGFYRVIGLSEALDGLTFFEYDATIINAWAFNIIAGTSGTTELDVKRGLTPGGAFASIFSTTPKFTSAAPNYSWVDANGIVTPPVGVTAPVVNPSMVNLPAGAALRVDLISAMGGFPENCGVIVHYRPN